MIRIRNIHEKMFPLNAKNESSESSVGRKRECSSAHMGDFH